MKARTNLPQFTLPVKLVGQPFRGQPTIRKLVSSDTPTGLWTRQCLEDFQSNWLVAVVLRISQIRDRTAEGCLVKCGGGHDVLVLLNDAPTPPNVSKIPSISVRACFAPRACEDPVKQYGLTCPTDPLWLLMYVAVKMNQDVSDFRVFLHTNTDACVYEENAGEKRVVRMHLVSNNWNAVHIAFEEQATLQVFCGPGQPEDAPPCMAIKTNASTALSNQTSDDIVS